ncbi:hypothetical protein KC19_11G003000 [Ceratodon purpureus]|uniref:YbaK/aminoacyl-tRNA synthetase-associated domain-containing protein n=1 Tax=Ceratodon purpureus TaxID=3225 RepID=A0A8T0G9P3_CERPU|nr:hypothetical protein KC19_11G003000 [Ceratodon purpureus]
MAHSRESLMSFLQEHGVECETHDHAVVMTVEEQAKHVGHLDGSFSKNLFLKDKKNRLYVVSTLSTTQVDLKALSARLGLGKGGVRMAPEESLHAVLQVPLGSVTPFALINESARSVALLLDVGFQKQSRVFFHPLSNDASTAVTPENLDKFLKAIGREPAYVDFEAAVVVGKGQPPDLANLVPKDEPKGTECQPGTAESQVPAVTPIPKQVPAVTPAPKQSPAISTKKPIAAVSKAKDVARVDIASVLASVLDNVVAAAVSGVNSLTLEEEKKRAVTNSIDAAIRLRLAPDLESTLMMFKNTMYAEGFKSAIESQRHSSTRQ